VKKVLNLALVLAVWFSLFQAPRVVLAEANLTPAAKLLVQLSDKEALVYPIVEPRISSKYGPRKHPITKSVRHHGGIDLAAPKGAHVRTVKGGLVIFAGEHRGFGNLVVVQHRPGVVSRYGHLSKIKTKVGKRIAAGTVIGLVGSTGLSTGDHLHFEWLENGKSVDPLKIIPGLTKPAQG